MQWQKRKSQGVWYTAIQGACVLQRQRRKAEAAIAKPKGSGDHWGGSVLQKSRSIRHKKEVTEKSNEWLGVKSVCAPLFTFSI